MNVIQLVSKMYDARDACRCMSAYEENMPKFKKLVLEKADQADKEVMDILVPLLTRCQEDPIVMMWIMAAAVEIVEPTP